MIKRPLIIHVISQVNTSHVFEWMGLELSRNHDVCFVLLNEGSSPLEDFFISNGIEIKRFRYRGKKDFFSAFLKTLIFFWMRRPKIVHAHLLDGQLIGLTAAWLAAVNVRIYTRHTSNYHQMYHSKGVWMDQWCNRFATKIISISQATDVTLMQAEQVSPSKVVTIPHGFDLSHFNFPSIERINQVHKVWNIQKTAPVVGVISRHIEWKGVQYIIPAFKKFLESFPEAQLVLANAIGPFHEQLKLLLQSIPTDRVVMIPFEADVVALYHSFDLYVHTPVDPICEAFGQTYVEALATGVPSIFTLSGIAAEFVEHEKNAWVVPFRDTEAISKALERLWIDKGFRTRLAEEGKRSVERFELKPTMARLEALYAGQATGTFTNPD
jgi:glycosyltransferase involved in cell wall biosynthesis